MNAYRIRLDPWSADYESAVQISLEEEPGADVDLDVEATEWRALRPDLPGQLPRAYFVDGVRRIEHRLLIETGGRTVFGLLGSAGVGATEAGERARIVETRIRRLAVTGGGLRIEAFEAALADGAATIRFEPEVVPETTPEAPLLGFQNAMRRAEASLASDLSTDGTLVFLDGPLGFLEPLDRPVVGFVKRLLRSYLPPEAASLLPALRVGERTPLFLIRDASGRASRYSCYLRIGSGRAIDAALTGVVRLETSAAMPLAQARANADTASAILPRHASDAARDPRAPQNLYPIGGLESRLRHLLGDGLVIRRAIEGHLHREAVA